MTDSTITPPTKLLEDHVLTVVNRMQRAYLAKNRSKGAAWLAELRRADAEPGVTPNTWLLEFDDFPPVLSGQDGKTTPAEKAAHLAFTLYAIHQQSQTTGMHQRGAKSSAWDGQWL